jgi:microcystin-dependent protein
MALLASVFPFVYKIGTAEARELNNLQSAKLSTFVKLVGDAFQIHVSPLNSVNVTLVEATGHDQRSFSLVFSGEAATPIEQNTYTFQHDGLGEFPLFVVPIEPDSEGLYYEAAMSEPFLAEVRIVGFNFAPNGWAFCDGQLLPIDQNQSLYSLLDTTYGGDGRTTFALPDLRGRTPVHVGNGHSQGQKGGEESHTLNPVEMPQHAHSAKGSSSNASSPLPGGNVLASANNVYEDPTTLTELHPDTVKSIGGQGHQNMQPFLTLNFVIALQGVFPSRN